LEDLNEQGGHMFRLLVYLMSMFIILIMPGVSHSVYEDIVVYGGGFAGCAAVHNAAMLAPDKSVLLIIPEPVSKPGGLGTVGGQNFTDIRFWKEKIVTQGTFGQWYNAAGQFYSADRMAEIIAKDLAQFPNLKIMYSSDVSFVELKGKKIDKIHIHPLKRAGNGSVGWQEGLQVITARVFIDASDDGRLAQMAGAPHTVGRQDWPADYLTESEHKAGYAYQQAATLMFKVSGLDKPDKPGTVGDITFSRDGLGSWGLAGGGTTWSSNALVTAFNERYKAEGFAIKPINAAQNGAGSSEWWVNTLLVYNVDGRAHDRDIGTPAYPKDTTPGHLTVDQAWIKARELLGSPDFIEALRQFNVSDGVREYGFGKAEMVLDEERKPVVGEVMYIRESVHGQLTKKSAKSDTENTNYAVTTTEAQNAGESAADGDDAANYADRIGLGYYMMDINAYRPEDINRNGTYRWPVTEVIRPDWLAAGGEPQNPVYLPFRMLIVENVKNLLVPGYATGCSSFAWAELRVLPNLAVLGDAAGAAAARAVAYNENPGDFTEVSINWVQDKLRAFGSRLEK
jgi:hypothetical protein